MIIDHIYKIQTRQGQARHWQTIYRLPTREQAELMYQSMIKNTAGGWQYRLMQRDECIAQAAS